MAAGAKQKRNSSYNELRAEIRKEKIARLYVFYGEESFLIDKLLESLEQALITPGSRDLDRVLLDGRKKDDKTDIARLREETGTMPFLSRRKLVIFRYSGWFVLPARKTADDEPEADREKAADSKKDAEELESLLAGLPDSTCLVFVEEKVDRRQKRLIQAVEQAGVLAEIGRQQPRMLKAWIEGEGKRRSIQISPQAAESLVDRCDSDMRLIWQELAKLFLYCDSTGCRQVDQELIETISLPDLKGSIFDLTDALSAGQTGPALQLLGRLISQKQPVQLISFMLGRHLRQLICAAELKSPEQIASRLKVMPFVAGRLSRQARNLDMDVLEQLYARCLATDMAVKTGKINDLLGLELLLIAASEAASSRQRR